MFNFIKALLLTIAATAFLYGFNVLFYSLLYWLSGYGIDTESALFGGAFASSVAFAYLYLSKNKRG